MSCNNFKHTLNMLLHYLGKFEVQICLKNYKWYDLKRNTERKNEIFRVIQLNAYWCCSTVAKTVHYLPAHTFEDTHIIRQLHFQLRSGVCHAKHSTSAATVRKCYAPVTDELVPGWRPVSCSRPKRGRSCSTATGHGNEKVLSVSEVVLRHVPGV